MFKNFVFSRSESFPWEAFLSFAIPMHVIWLHWTHGAQMYDSWVLGISSLDPYLESLGFVGSSALFGWGLPDRDWPVLFRGAGGAFLGSLSVYQSISAHFSFTALTGALCFTLGFLLLIYCIPTGDSPPDYWGYIFAFALCVGYGSQIYSFFRFPEALLAARPGYWISSFAGNLLWSLREWYYNSQSPKLKHALSFAGHLTASGLAFCLLCMVVS